MDVTTLTEKLKALDLNELSKRSGVGVTTLKDIRSGKTYDPHYSTLLKIKKSIKGCPKLAKRGSRHP